MSKGKTVVTPPWYSMPNRGDGVSVEGGCPGVADINAECPSLGVALTGQGTPKEGGIPPLSVKVFADQGVMKIALQDAYNKRSAFVTLTSQGSLGEQLQRILEDTELDWRAWGAKKTWG